MNETKDHILYWVNSLKQDIYNINPEDEDYNFEQAMECLYKLESYLTKLERGEYDE